MSSPITGLDDGQNDPTIPKPLPNAHAGWTPVGPPAPVPSAITPGPVAPPPSKFANWTPVAADATRAPGAYVDPLASYDKTSGAPLKVRLAIAASGSPDDQLAIAKKYLPNARMTPGGMAFDGPTGPTLVTPHFFGNTNLGANVGNLLTLPGRAGTSIGAILGGLAGTPADVVSGPGGTIAGAAAGGLAGGQAGNVIQKLLATLAGKPGVDTRSLRTLGAGMAQDAVTGVGQEALGLGGGALARGIAGMGGRIGARTAAADAAGAPLTVGQTLGSPILQKLETANAVIPTGAGIMGRFGARQAAALGTKAQSLAEIIAGGPVPSKEEAGILAQQAASRIGKSFEAERQPLAETFRTAVDTKFPPTPPTVDAPTNAELLAKNPGDASLRRSYSDAIKAGTADQWATQIPGATKGPVTGIPLTATEALVKELQQTAAKSSLKADVSPALAKAQSIVADAHDGTLDAADLLRHRTTLGRAANYSSPLTAPDPGQTYIKKLYGALSTDIQGAAQAAGPEAQQALAAHDALVSDFRGGGKNSPGAFWNSVENAKTPGAAFDLITKHPNDAAALADIKSRMTPQEFAPIAARHFLDLGQATPGAGGADVFSPESFLSQWRGKGMNAEVQSQLYGGADGALPAGTPDFLKTLQAVKSSGAYRNPGGAAGMLQGTQFLRDLLSVPAMLQEGVTGGASHLAHTPKTFLATTFGPMATAKAFTSGGRAAGKIASGVGGASGKIADILSEIFPPVGGHRP